MPDLEDVRKTALFGKPWSHLAWDWSRWHVHSGAQREAFSTFTFKTPIWCLKMVSFSTWEFWSGNDAKPLVARFSMGFPRCQAMQDAATRVPQAMCSAQLSGSWPPWPPWPLAQLHGFWGGRTGSCEGGPALFGRQRGRPQPWPTVSSVTLSISQHRLPKDKKIQNNSEASRVFHGFSRKKVPWQPEMAGSIQESLPSC